MTNSIIYGTQNTCNKTPKTRKSYKKSTKRIGTTRKLVDDLALAKLQEVGLARSFEWKGLQGSITAKQFQMLNEIHIEQNLKLDYDRYIYVPPDSFHLPANHYHWRNIEEKREIYQDRCIDRFPTNNKIRLKPSLKTTNLYISNLNLINALKLAFKTEHFRDISILMNSRRIPAGHNVLFTCQYSEDNTSRLSTAFQQISKTTRSELFRNWYDVDINASMPALMAQRSPIPSPKLNEYISDKSVLRNHICNMLNCDLQTSKSIINAAFYGVKTHPNTIYWDLNNMEAVTFFVKNLGLKASRIASDPICRDFFQEIRLVAKTIADELKSQCEKINGSWYYYNDSGGLLKLKRNWNPGKACSHWYFGVERLVLNQMDISDTNLLLIHDGLLSKSPLNTQKLELQIYNNTGYNLKLDVCKLGV